MRWCRPWASARWIFRFKWQHDRVTEAAITALTQLAEAAYVQSDPRGAREKWPGMLGVINDPDRSQVMALATRGCRSELSQAVSVLSREPDLSIFQPISGQANLSIVYPGGSTGLPFSELIVALLTSAAQQHYYLRQELTSESFLSTVLKNYQQMMRLAHGEKVKGFILVGFTGVTLAEDVSVKTPWGFLKPAPRNFRVGLGFNMSSAILAVRSDFELAVSHEQFPRQITHRRGLPPRVDLARQMVPIAFALATEQHARCTPMVTFYAELLPVVELTSFQAPETFLPLQSSITPSDQELRLAEQWMRSLLTHRSSSLEVAYRRLVFRQRTQAALWQVPDPLSRTRWTTAHRPGNV